MTDYDGPAATEWERHKFSVETELREKELRLSENRLKADNRRNILISVLVPVVITLMTALPTFLSSYYQLRLEEVTSLRQLEMEEVTFEGQLITEAVKTGDPDQAAENLGFLVEVGLLSGERRKLILGYLEHRPAGTGRALPPP